MNFINVFAVDVFTLDGQFIGNWPTIRGACKGVGIKYNCNINKCLKEPFVYASGYKWVSHPTEVPLLIGEEWKPVSIPGLENLYAISNKGRAASTFKKNKETFTILSQYTLNDKYNVVHFWIGNKRKGFYVHRLVAQAFLPNPQNKPEVDHIDTNSLNNNVENLRWVTTLENHYNPITLERTMRKVYAMIESGLGVQRSNLVTSHPVKHTTESRTEFYKSISQAARETQHTNKTITDWCKQNKYGWSFTDKQIEIINN